MPEAETFKLYHANEQVVKRVMMNTGMVHREAQLAVMATCKAIVDQLSEGRDVELRHLGSFYFRMAKPRRVPRRQVRDGTWLPEIHLPSRPLLKFHKSPYLYEKLKRVRPKRVRTIPRWSDKRYAPNPTEKNQTPEPTPSQIQSQADAASPSNPVSVDVES